MGRGHMTQVFHLQWGNLLTVENKKTHKFSYLQRKTEKVGCSEPKNRNLHFL